MSEAEINRMQILFEAPYLNLKRDNHIQILAIG